MKKKFKLKLSSPEITYKGKGWNNQGGLIDVVFNKREQELNILIQLLQIAKDRIKKPKELNMCLDTMAMLDSYIENKDCMKTEIEIDEQDLNWLAEGIENSAGAEGKISQRTGGWYKCREILRQISEPEEIGTSTETELKKE